MNKSIHYLQITDDRQQSPLRRRCIESVKAIVRPEDTYEMVSFKWVADPFKRAQTAELIRFEKAKCISNLCYIDTDCFIHKPFYPEDQSAPYFGEYAFNDAERGMPDIFYFFVNGHTDYFIKHFSKLYTGSNAYSIDVQVLRSLTQFKLIPESSYVHCYNTMNYLHEKQVESSNTKISINDLELTAMKKTVELLMIQMNTFNELRQQHG